MSERQGPFQGSIWTNQSIRKSQWPYLFEDNAARGLEPNHLKRKTGTKRKIHFFAVATLVKMLNSGRTEACRAHACWYPCRRTALRTAPSAWRQSWPPGAGLPRTRPSSWAAGTLLRACTWKKGWFLYSPCPRDKSCFLSVLTPIKSRHGSDLSQFYGDELNGLFLPPPSIA